MSSDKPRRPWVIFTPEFRRALRVFCAAQEVTQETLARASGFTDGSVMSYQLGHPVPWGALHQERYTELARLIGYRKALTVPCPTETLDAYAMSLTGRGLPSRSAASERRAARPDGKITISRLTSTRGRRS